MSKVGSRLWFEPCEVLHRDVTDGDLPTKSFLRIFDSVLFFSLRQTRCFQLPRVKATCLLLMEGFVLCLLILICQ